MHTHTNTHTHTHTHIYIYIYTHTRVCVCVCVCVFNVFDIRPLHISNYVILITRMSCLLKLLYDLSIRVPKMET
jgi:hypothetical protein